MHALGLPTSGVERPRNVVPENINLSVIGEQLADVCMNVFDEALARSLVRRAASAVGLVPVHQRIVKYDAHTFAASDVHIFADQLAAQSLLRQRLIGRLDIELAKTLAT